MTRLLAWPRWLLGSTLIVGVRFYQFCLRPLLPPVCRFHPSCSEYFIQAVRKYGPLSGAWRGVCRLAGLERGSPARSPRPGPRCRSRWP